MDPQVGNARTTEDSPRTNVEAVVTVRNPREEKQLKGRKIYLGSLFQRFQVQLAPSFLAYAKAEDHSKRHGVADCSFHGGQEAESGWGKAYSSRA